MQWRFRAISATTAADVVGQVAFHLLYTEKKRTKNVGCGVQCFSFRFLRIDPSSRKSSSALYTSIPFLSSVFRFPLLVHHRLSFISSMPYPVFYLENSTPFGHRVHLCLPVSLDLRRHHPGWTTLLRTGIINVNLNLANSKISKYRWRHETRLKGHHHILLCYPWIEPPLRPECPIQSS